MNESKFEELVNLCFDREISAAELECLKQELATRSDRRREFQSRHRLHQATCSALFSGTTKVSGQSAHTGQTNPSGRYTLPILPILGIAACFLVVFAASVLTISESANSANTTIAEAEAADSFGGVRNSGDEGRELKVQVNLSSQLRLAGLTPDIAPTSQQLSIVDTEALRKKKAHLQDMIEEVDHYKMYSAIPKPQLVEYDRTYEISSNNDWPTGFKSSLASFR